MLHFLALGVVKPGSFVFAIVSPKTTNQFRWPDGVSKASLSIVLTTKPSFSWRTLRFTWPFISFQRFLLPRQTRHFPSAIQSNYSRIKLLFRNDVTVDWAGRVIIDWPQNYRPNCVLWLEVFRPRANIHRKFRHKSGLIIQARPASGLPREYFKRVPRLLWQINRSIGQISGIGANIHSLFVLRIFPPCMCGKTAWIKLKISEITSRLVSKYASTLVHTVFMHFSFFF